MSDFQPQTAWISASTAETGMRVRAFIRSVYAWMFGGLLLTAFAGLWVASSTAMQQLIFGNKITLIVLIGIVICSVVNLFLRSSGLSFVISIVGVFVFVGLTAWDTQKLKSYATVGGPMQESLAVYGALALYLDFVNLFLFLLRIFGDRRR